ncbi:MAG: hypothetical protein LLG04_05935 [Parachlamydia sp.]|nr:hypothetical protein [Parachlamydia sp.]
MQATDQLPILNVYKLPDFPKHLNIHEKEAFTSETWSNLFARAVANHVPNYAIAVVPLSLGKTQRYNIYDALALRNFILECKQKGQTPLDPLTRSEICRDKIKFMAVKCFDLDPNGWEIRVVPLHGQEFKPFFPTVQNICKNVRNQMGKLQNFDKKVADRNEQPLWDSITATWRRLYPSNEPVEKAVAPTLQKLVKYALDGVNPHNIEHLTMHRVQSIVSNAWDKLIDVRKAKIWKFCSDWHEKQAPENATSPAKAPTRKAHLI